MSLGLFFEEKNRVLRVAELALAIKQLLESEVPLLWVRGEISNLVKAASGHYYFSLKDDQAQVRCVMFRHKNQLLSNSLGNGQQIEVLAAATLYEQRGDFQLTVEQVRPAGQGVLYERFAQLKLKLQSEGLFDAARKRPLPRHPERIGIVTSLQAAALRDVLATLRGRQPGVPVVLYPAPVQGTGSAEQIAAALRSASQRKECDVLIVCRGGGSIEDPSAVNEEGAGRGNAARHHLLVEPPLVFDAAAATADYEHVTVRTLAGGANRGCDLFRAAAALYGSRIQHHRDAGQAQPQGGEHVAQRDGLQ